MPPFTILLISSLALAGNIIGRKRTAAFAAVAKRHSSLQIRCAIVTKAQPLQSHYLHMANCYPVPGQQALGWPGKY